MSYLVVKNRLAAPAPGPMWEAEAFNVPLLYVGQGDRTAWLTVQEQFAPFGYVPVEARGMPAFELSIDGQRPLTVPDVGDQDRLEYEGKVRLAPDGSARITLRQRFVGKYAIRLRAGLTQVPEGRLHEVLQTRLLGQALPGAELLDFAIEGQNDLDAPLVVQMQAGGRQVRRGGRDAHGARAAADAAAHAPGEPARAPDTALDPRGHAPERTPRDRARARHAGVGHTPGRGEARRVSGGRARRRGRQDAGARSRGVDCRRDA